MKILITIPHYFNSSGDNSHGSGRKEFPRINALTNCLFSIYSLFSPAQSMIDIRNKKTLPVNETSISNIDVVICTTNEKHLLEKVIVPSNFFIHKRTEPQDPMFLGFECQKVLKENLGKYDFYCFMEDDLIIHDPLFFQKLKWFNAIVDDKHLLLPNRYEVSSVGKVLKAYVDGDINARATEKFQDIKESASITSNAMGESVTFRRPLNTHSGCFFLTQTQMEYWANQPYFLDMDASFISPLESAASLGTMKTFKVYKPCPQNANFLEIQHFGNMFLSLIGNKIVIK